MERMQSEAQELSAEGIVGVDLQEKNHGWGSHTIEFFALGTAVIANEHVGDNHQLPDITPVLDIKPYMAEFAPRGSVRQPAWSHELMRGYWS